MKNVILTTKYVLMALVMVFVFSCAEDGAVGPQGVPGKDGTDGADGADGVDGNANVMSSDWFRPPSYTLSTGFGGIKLLEHDEAAPGITQEIIDSGVVLVYGKLNGYAVTIWPKDQVALLPITLTYNVSPTHIDTWSALLTPGNIKIMFINNNNLFASIATSHEFRYVIIPSSNSNAGRISKASIEELLANEGVDINNYEEVAEYYGI